MSFKDWDLSNDPALIENLDNLLKKRAQANNVVSTARKLVNNLQRQMFNMAPPANIQTPQPTPVNFQALNSFDSFAKYLINSKMTVDGERVMLSAAEMQSPEFAEKADLYDPVSPKGTRDNQAQDRRFGDGANSYVRLPALVKYIRHLQEKAKSLKEDNNPESKINNNTLGQVLETLVGKLIDFTNNRIDSNSGLSRKPKSQPGVPNEISDETNVDWFNEKFLDEKNPMADVGNQIPLKAKDLKNRQALNNWLLTAPTARIAHYGEIKSWKEYGAQDNDPCITMRALYLRARSKAQYARNDEEQKTAQWYLKKMTELAPTFTGLDGKPCNLSAQPGQQQSGQKPGESPSGQLAGSELNAIVARLAQQDMLPLATEDIDFARIETWFTEYEKLLNNNIEASGQQELSDIKSYINNARQLITSVRQRLAGPGRSTFPIDGANATIANNWARPPAGDNVIALLTTLRQIVGFVGEVTAHFYKHFAKSMTPQSRALVAHQGTGTGSIRSYNESDIATILSDMSTKGR